MQTVQDVNYKLYCSIDIQKIQALFDTIFRQNATNGIFINFFCNSTDIKWL